MRHHGRDDSSNTWLCARYARVQATIHPATQENSPKLGHPRLNQIIFHTFRHWKATMEYHKTKDILYVMRLLGHKNIKNMLVYTQLVTFEDDDYVCKAAANVKEATELIETGYE